MRHSDTRAHSSESARSHYPFPGSGSAAWAILLAGLSASAPATSLLAQSPSWTATEIVQAYPSPFLSDWERFPAIGILSLTYTGSTPVDYKIRVSLTNLDQGDVGTVESPLQSAPGGPITQIFYAPEIAGWPALARNGTFVNLILKTGQLPEGRYRSCATVVTAAAGTQLAQGCGEFVIILPEPPQLINPVNGDEVVTTQPFFTWTPVLAAPGVNLSYKFKLVEILGSQQPEAAIAANIPLLDSLVTRVPSLLYPISGLPLEKNKRYAWQVTAVTEDGQQISRANAASEIWTFTMGDNLNARLDLTNLPDTLVLVPGIAQLTGIRSLQTKQSGDELVINGRPTFEYLGSPAFSTTVTVQDLHAAMSGLTLAVRSGQISLPMPNQLLPAGVSNMLQFGDLVYAPATGLQTTLGIKLPGGTSTPLTGTVQLGPSGFVGAVSGQAGPGQSLGAFTAGPVTFRLTQVSATLPGGDVRLTGALDLFDRDAGCESIGGRVGADGKLAIDAFCTPKTPLQLAAGVTRMGLDIASIGGQVTVGLADQSLDFNLSASTSFRIDGPSGANCGASFDLAVTPKAVNAANLVTRCDAGEGAVDLGWLRLQLSNLKLDRFAWTNNALDWQLSLDLAPSTPTIPTLSLPAIQGVVLGSDGMKLPALDVPLSTPQVQLGSIGARLTHVRLPGFTLSWANWQAGSADGFNFSLDAEFNLQSVGGSSAACLSSAPLIGTTVTLARGRFDAIIQDHDFTPSCTVDIASGLSFGLEHIGGGIGLSLANGISFDRYPEVRGTMTLPPLFDCGPGGDRSLPITTPIELTADGHLKGKVTGIAPACPINLATLSLYITDAELDFDIAQSGPSAVLSGGAKVQLDIGGAPIAAQGTMSVDLVSGRLLSGSLTIPGPVDIKLPRDNPILDFRVNQLSLDADGLHVDGRQQLIIDGGAAIGVTFDKVVVNPQLAGLSSGRILFDAAFALDAGISGAGTLAWKAVSPDKAFDLETGLRIVLPNQIAVDKTGLSITGTATARLKYGGEDRAQLSANFSSDFRLAFQPVGVTQGRVDLIYSGSTLAWVDPLGFHPSAGGIANLVLPARLPLPSEQVAYLQLRDAQNNLIVQPTDESGGLRIKTAPGQSVALVFPALQMKRPSPPQLLVSLNILLDGSTHTVKDGSIEVQVPAEAADAFDFTSMGVPLSLESVKYERSADGPFRFTFKGAITLFNDRTAPGSISLVLGEGGLIHADVAVYPAKRFPMVDGSNKLVFALDTVRGTIDGGAAQPLTFDLDAAGGMELATSETQSWKFHSTLHISEKEFAVKSVDMPTDSVSAIDADGFKLWLAHPRIPTLSYNYATRKFDFEFLFDIAMQFPALQSLVLPPIKDVSLRSDGFTIPQYEVSNVGADALKGGAFGIKPDMLSDTVKFNGFALRVLAFRISQLKWNWLTGGLPAHWGFGVDLSIKLADIPAGESYDAFRGMELRALNVGITDGALHGAIERISFPKPLAIGPVNVLDVWGNFWAAVGQQPGTTQTDPSKNSTLYVTASINLPNMLACPDQANAQPVTFGDASVTTGGSTHTASWTKVAGSPVDTLAIHSDPQHLYVIGTLHGVAPSCPGTLGPFSFQVTRSDVHLGYDTQRGVIADMAATVNVKAPGPNTTDSISATGSLSVDLAKGQILDASIA